MQIALIMRFVKRQVNDLGNRTHMVNNN